MIITPTDNLNTFTDNNNVTAVDSNIAPDVTELLIVIILLTLLLIATTLPLLVIAVLLLIVLLLLLRVTLSPKRTIVKIK